MSTEVVSWKEEAAAEAKAIAANFRPSVGRINFKNGVMTYAGNPIAGNSVKVVVVGSVFERNLYLGRYDPDKIVNPDCYSLSSTPTDTVPHESIPQPQSQTCATCKYNEWGSDLQGRKGKACKELVRLAVISVDMKDFSPEAITKADLAICKLPVTSVKNWGNYVNFLAGSLGLPPHLVVTEIWLTPDPKTQFKVNFKEVAAIENAEMYAAIKARMAPAVNALNTPYDYKAEAEELAKQDSTKKKKY